MKKLLSTLLLTLILSIPFQAGAETPKTFTESFIITHIENDKYYGKSLETDSHIFFTIDDINDEKDYPLYSLIIATINEYEELEYIEKAVINKDHKIVPYEPIQ